MFSLDPKLQMLLSAVALAVILVSWLMLPAPPPVP